MKLGDKLVMVEPIRLTGEKTAWPVGTVVTALPSSAASLKFGMSGEARFQLPDGTSAVLRLSSLRALS